MKKGKKALSVTISMILMLVLILGVSYAAKEDNDVSENKIVDSITIIGENCNIDIQKSENNKLVCDYNSDLFEVITKCEEDKLTILSKSKENSEATFSDGVVIYIPDDMTYKKVNIQSQMAGISLCEINSELNIVNNKGAVSFYVPKEFNHNITYTSNNGSGAVNFCNGAENYKLKLCKEKSAISMPFDDYDNGESTYIYTNGDGSSNINLNINNSAFSVNID